VLAQPRSQPESCTISSHTIPEPSPRFLAHRRIDSVVGRNGATPSNWGRRFEKAISIDDGHEYRRRVWRARGILRGRPEYLQTRRCLSGNYHGRHPAVGDLSGRLVRDSSEGTRIQISTRKRLGWASPAESKSRGLWMSRRPNYGHAVTSSLSRTT
jgi:hypothetical protein